MSDEHSADSVLAGWCEKYFVPGARAGVRHLGGSDRFVATGVDGRWPDTPMTARGSFRIGSVTKTFTSAIVLDLVSRGDLSLDTTIQQLVGDYPHADAITVRHLLEHTAGTADPLFDDQSGMFGLLLADLERSFEPHEVIDLARALKPFAAPGESYRYSNTDYHLLGLVAEQIRQQPFSAALREVCTAPLHLERTIITPSTPDDMVHGWFDLDLDRPPGIVRARNLDVLSFPATALVTSAYSAGGVTSTLGDLLTWGEALYLGTALPAETRNELLASPVHADPDAGVHGLGVFGFGQQSADGRWDAYGHTGNIIGSSTFLAAFPRYGATVAVHANVQEVTSHALAEVGSALVSAVLGVR